MILRLTVFLLLAFPLCTNGQITWLTDLNEAKKLARQTGKPIMYDFTASWCGPCKRMERDFWPRQDVVELSTRFVCVKVNFDNEKGLASKYGIVAIPNVVFTDPWGRGLLGQRGFGAGSDTEIFEKIKLLPKDFKSLLKAGDALDANDDDPEALYQFAEFYQTQKFYWLGNNFYRKLVKVETDPSKRENIQLNIAFNYIRLGEPGEAIDRLEELQKEFPNSTQNDIFLYGLVYASVEKNKVQNANKFLATLKSKFPKSPYVAAAERSIAAAGGVGK